MIVFDIIYVIMRHYLIYPKEIATKIWVKKGGGGYKGVRSVSLRCIRALYPFDKILRQAHNKSANERHVLQLNTPLW